jgi:uncharacterized protein
MSISTPCIKLCVIEPSLRLCIGCGRSIDEISQWAGLTEPERQNIMAELAPRLSGIALRDSGRVLPSQRRKMRISAKA